MDEEKQKLLVEEPDIPPENMEPPENNISPNVEVALVPQEEIKDELLPEELDTITLDEATVKLVNDIVKTGDIAELKNLTKMFEITQAKKNALRIVKLNNLLDKVNDQAIERFESRPYEISNKELLDYMQVVQGQIEKSQKTVSKIDETPLVQINQQNNSINVNVDGDSLDRDSRDRVIEAVKALLAAAAAPVEDVIVEKTTVVDIEENTTDTIEIIEEE